MKTLLLSLLLTPMLAAATVIEKMATHAQALLDTLSKEQQEKITFPFGDDERENWHYIPRERAGIQLDAFDEPQQKLVQTLLEQSLSAQGYVTAQQVIELENILFEESDQADFRNPARYTVTVFGKPSSKESWGWRFEGHHLSLNFTLINGTVGLTTPFFFGTNPAEVQEGPKKGMRPLGKIEDQARELARTIHRDGLHVRYSNEPPRDILTGQDRTAKALAKEGVPFYELKKEQQSALLALVQQIAAHQHQELFKPITAEDLADAMMAWAGDFEPKKPHYFRIQTPVFLIEYANTQNNANHAHLVWRDFANDFGRDLLREHLEHEH